MLSSPQGNLMVDEALRGISYEPSDLIFVILQQHEAEYQISKSLFDIFGEEISVVYLDQKTSSQPETIFKAIKKLNIDPNEPVLIKDSDNTFELDNIDFDSSYICYDTLGNHPHIDPLNKGYCVLGEEEIVKNCSEKEVVSDTFSVGGYFFKKVSSFIDAYESLSNSSDQKELYMTHLINFLIQKGESFKGRIVSSYLDWGTKKEWDKFCESFATYIVDIDGVLVENSAEYFQPFWGETEGIPPNISTINSLHSKGSRIILLTSRKEKFRQKTIDQLKKVDLSYDQLIMDCLHGKRFLINDFSDSNPFPTSLAVNIKRNSSDLKDKISESKPSS